MLQKRMYFMSKTKRLPATPPVAGYFKAKQHMPGIPRSYKVFSYTFSRNEFSDTMRPSMNEISKLNESLKIKRLY